MTVVFNNFKNATRECIENVDYVEVGYAKVNGRVTKFWYVYTKDDVTRTFKYKDHEIYWFREE